MATRAHHILSAYEAPSSRTVDELTLELEAAEDALAWSQGTLRPFTKPLKFVKPSGLYDEHGRPIETPPEDEDDEIQFIGHKPAEIGSWYRGLKRDDKSQSERPARPAEPPTAPKTVSSKHAASNKNSPWFLSRVLSGTSTPTSTPGASSSTTSLPEMLSREPPPLPSETPFVPPTWTVLGPTNQGYNMLQKLGWEEGKPLGLTSRSSGVETEPGVATGMRQGIGYKGKEKPPDLEDDVVDLTLESDESGSDSDDAPPSRTLSDTVLDISHSGSKRRTVHDGRALLTPLPTVLKGDRAGIGSRAGVTKSIKQTSEALKLLEMKKARRRKRDVGPDMSIGGAKRFARMAQRDARSRKDLLASLNS